MSNFTLITYIRLKATVTILRFVVALGAFLPLRRDRLSTSTAAIECIRIPSRQPGRTITAELYIPPDSTSARPVLINWHGSGFIFPLHGSDSVYCARVAKEAGVFVLDADYRHAPEFPFPKPLEDVEDVLKWVDGQSSRFDLSRVGVSGFSAGATLALTAASGLRKKLDNAKIILAVALYPVTDLSIDYSQKTVPRPINPHPPFMANLFNDCYAPELSLRSNPRVSPGLADPSTFPDTIVLLTCEGDNFAPEGDALAEKLQDGKRRVVHKRLKDIHHGFDKGVKEGTKEWDRREEAYGIIVRTLKETFETA
ncbi:Alpha/Beta hydrolase protein [Massariosphaeria phaeospora]|uniref:Alpha/Beta hydrolase protein n=1 Tax=Massariosphaeria phaeospora TaxID=100035 RepID=A0A7C8I3T3_9PLEO|nr:Alpha/Beta hydrolase protein [Massariosphaeria phaeospora]